MSDPKRLVDMTLNELLVAISMNTQLAVFLQYDKLAKIDEDHPDYENLNTDMNAHYDRRNNAMREVLLRYDPEWVDRNASMDRD